jgi:hypothetical protein
MKYLKTYNESLRDKMKPKTDEEIFSELANESDIEIFLHSLQNNYLKGIKHILDKKNLNYRYINLIKQHIYSVKNKEIIKYFLSSRTIKKHLKENTIYILEKYKLGLHQNEEKDFEKYIKDILDYDNFNKDENNILYVKNNDLTFTIEIFENIYKHLIIDKNKYYEIINFGINVKEMFLIFKTLIKDKLNIEIDYMKYDDILSDIVITESLRDKMKPKSDEEILNSLGDLTPEEILAQSVENNYTKGVEIALEKGVDVNIFDLYGDTPLITASKRGFIEIVELLLKNNADVNKKNINDITALNIASMNNRKKIVELLIKNGADVNLHSVFGTTPLMNASYGGHKDVVEILIKNDADINKINIKDETALTLAKKEGHKEIVELLKKHGAKE